MNSVNLKGANVNAGDSRSTTPLHVAAMYSHITEGEILLQNGASAKAITPSGATPLHLVAVEKYPVSNKQTQFDFIDLLLRYGCNIDERTDEGYTPMHIAVNNGVLRVVEHLIKRGAKFEFPGDNVPQPIHIAAKDDEWEIVRTLVEAGADINIQDERGRTALHLSAQIDSEMLMKVLLPRGADTEVRDEEGQTVLHHAFHHFSRRTIDLLIKYGADINAKDHAGLTPLQYLRSASSCSPWLRCHLMKMRVAGLLSSEVPNELIELIDGHPVRKFYEAQCKEELSQSSSVYVGNTGKTFLQLLRMSPEDLYAYKNNQDFSKVLLSHKFEYDAMFYAEMLQFKFRRVLVIEKAVERAKPLFWQHVNPDLPEHSVEKILLYAGTDGVISFLRKFRTMKQESHDNDPSQLPIAEALVDTKNNFMKSSYDKVFDKSDKCKCGFDFL